MSYISKISPDGGTNTYQIKDEVAGSLLTCSTSRATAAKTVAFTGFELFTGAKIAVRFTDTGSSNPASGNITLNVNNTGDKAVKDNSDTAMTYSNGGDFAANKTYIFIYDGTSWILMGKIVSGGGGSTDLTGQDTADVLLLTANEL